MSDLIFPAEGQCLFDKPECDADNVDLAGGLPGYTHVQTIQDRRHDVDGGRDEVLSARYPFISGRSYPMEGLCSHT
jgi:hypothetical protein